MSGISPPVTWLSELYNFSTSTFKPWAQTRREELEKEIEMERLLPESDFSKSIRKTWSQSQVRPRSPAAPPLSHMVQGESIYVPELEERSSWHDVDQIRRRFNKDYLDYYYDIFPWHQLKIIAANDDRDLFLEFLDHYATDVYLVRSLWLYLFYCDSVNCVTAVLDGETKGLFEFPPYIDSRIADPMELAADSGSYRLISLLLVRFGPHVANIRDSAHQLHLSNALVTDDRWSNPTVSIYHRLLSLCSMTFRPNMESVRILAYHTEGLQQEFIKYAMEGSAKEVATLLLVAREKVLPLCSDLRKQMVEKIASLHFHDARSALTSGTDFFTHKRMFLQLTLAWFEIFEKVGDKLFAYLCLPKEDWMIVNDLCDMLECAGFSIDYMEDYASNLSYRHLPELFRDQTIIMPSCSLKHEGDIRDGAVIGIEGRYNPKAEGQLEESIGADDSNNFVGIVAYRMKRECLSENNSLFAGELLRSICYHNSVECATVLLEGKTNVRIELNTALEDGSYPIHLAATSLSPGVTDLFLRHGAQTNVQCNNRSSPCYGMFPLELALEALRLHRCVGDWMPTKSLFKLIYIFCLPELMGPLKTIELLSCDIPVVQKICSRCVQEGKLIELCALLMVSWDMLVSPGHEGDIGSSFIDKHIINDLQTLAIEEAKFICTNDNDGLQQARWKKGGLLFALSLLETFKLAGAAIQDYRLSSKVKDVANSEVSKDISNLLRDLGFCLKTDDIDVKDIKCLLPDVESEQSGSEKDGAQPLKPCILPGPSENCEVSDDVDVRGYEKYIPMYHEGSWSLEPQPIYVCQIPKAKAFNQDGIPLPPRLNKFGYLPRQSPSNPVIATKRSCSSCLPRQSSSSPVFETNRSCHIYLPSQSSTCHLYNTKRSWSFVAFASKRCLRFVRV